MKTWRKVAILTLFYLDCVLHTQLMLGWSSISEMLSQDGFFRTNSSCDDVAVCDQNQNQAIGQVLVITSSLLGFVMFLNGAIRDTKPALARIMMNVFIIASYVLMAMALPGKTDWFQYFWLLQFSSSLGIYQHHIQYCRLFPSQIGALVGLSAGLIALSTVVPQLWLLAITNFDMTLQMVLLIWAGLASLSFILGLFLYPARNLPQDVHKMSDEMTINTVQLFFRRTSDDKDGSFLDAFRQIKINAKYLKSPIYAAQVCSFVFGNFTFLVSVNIVNDIMHEYATLHQGDYLQLQGRFELVRGIIQICTGPVIGFITDLSLARIWSKKKQDDVAGTFIIYGGIVTSMCLLSLALFITVNHVWFYLVIIPLVGGLVFTYLSMGMAMNFPVSCHGTLFGVMNIIGSVFNQAQSPIIKRVKAGEGLITYQSIQLIMTAVLIPCGILVVMIG